MTTADHRTWLVDAFARIAAIPQNRLHERLPWEWKRLNGMRAATATDEMPYQDVSSGLA